MIRNLSLCLVVLLFPCAVPEMIAAAPEGFTPLFDGKSLDGWEGKESMFRVEDGCIVGGTLKERIPNNEFLCTTKEYENFELRLKVKAIGEGVNAGVQFRTKRIPNHHEVSGYQADVGAKWWGKLYDESRRRKVLAGKDGAKVNVEDWNDYVIRAEGPHIQLWLNGVQTVDYTEKEEGIDRSGIIAVQIHGGPPSEAWYKDIYIKELPPSE